MLLRLATMTLAIACGPGIAQTPDVARSPFRAETHFEDAGFASEAQPVLDRAWALIVQHLGVPRGGEVKPMTVHVYAERPDYEAASKAHGGPNPKVFPGFADYETGTAHLLGGVRLRLDAGQLAPWVVSGIAHETTHLAVAAVRGRSMAFYPRWYVEGIAMWCEDAIATGGHDEETSGGAFRDIYSVGRARTLLRDGRVRPVADIVAGDTGDLSQVDEYPVHRVLFGLLMEEHVDAMAVFLPRSLDLPVSPAVPDQLHDLLRDALGDQVWRTIDERLHARILALAEDIPEIEVDPPPDAHGEPGDADYHPGSPEIRWTGETRASHLRVSALVTLRDAGLGQTDFAFGRTGASCLRVSLASGSVLVLARDRAGDEPGGWEVLARSGAVPRLAVGAQVRVEIAAFTGSVRVSIDGKRAVTARTGRRPIAGGWGIGAPRGCRASWKHVKVR